MLRRTGVELVTCRNVTDVDDVLDAAAQRAGAHYDRFAAVQQFHFERDMDALSVRRPTHEPRAHAFVPQVVELAAALLEAGAAYESAGSVFFRGGAGRGGAAGCRPEQALPLLAANGGRPDDPDKDDPLDQAVWQSSTGDEPAWPSARGVPAVPGGTPSARPWPCRGAYGPWLDLHAGGADLRFPHHAYESAQAEAATSIQPFARSWLHIGTVRLDGEKMAKSTGNLVFVRDLLAQTERGAVVRTLLLDRPYALPWDRTDAGGARARGQPAGRAAVRRRPTRSGSDSAPTTPSWSGSSTTSTCPPPGTSPWRTAARPPARPSRCSAWPDRPGRVPANTSRVSGRGAPSPTGCPPTVGPRAGGGLVRPRRRRGGGLMGVGTRWWRRVESEEDNDAWGGPDDVTVAPDPRTPIEDDGREARETAEREAREQADREAREAAEGKARKQAKREARETAERQAREQAEREAQETAEREARETAEREAREQAERQAREAGRARSARASRARSARDRRARSAGNRRAPGPRAGRTRAHRDRRALRRRAQANARPREREAREQRRTRAPGA